jgi:hypothetical protein
MKNVYIMLNGAKRNEASIGILRCTQNDKSYLIQQRQIALIKRIGKLADIDVCKALSYECCEEKMKPH